MISHCVCDFTSLFISPLLPLMDVLVVSGFIAVIFLVQVPCYASDSLGNISRSRVDRLYRVCDLKEIMPNCSEVCAPFSSHQQHVRDVWIDSLSQHSPVSCFPNNVPNMVKVNGSQSSVFKDFLGIC